MGHSRVPEPSELEFQPLPELVDVDVDALLTNVPPSITSKQFFIEVAMRRVADRMSSADILARAGVVAVARAPFDDLPWHDYFRVLCVVAELLHGREQLSVGLREIGRGFYPSLLATPIGPMLLGRHLGEAIRKAAEVWQTFTPVGKVAAEFRGEREFYYHFVDYPQALLESVGAGLFEGLFRHHHMPVDMQLARPTANHSIVRLRW